MSRFNIKKIKIQNFRSIQSEVILDIKQGLFSIIGINMDEPSSTNGAGKTTIVSALYWCLTGNTLTNEVLADEIVNITTGKDCRVSLYINSDQGEIKITRTRKDTELGNNLILEINGQDLSCHKIADTQLRINQLLKIPFDLLHSTILMTYDIRSAFSELSPQQRVNVLESIRDYSIWNKVRDEANKDIKEYNKQIQDDKLEISNLEGRISTYNDMYNKNTILLENTIKNFNIDTINDELNRLNNEKNIILAEYNDLNAKLNEFNSKNYPNNLELQEKLKEIVDNANKLKLNKQKIEYDIQSLQKEINLIDKWFKDDKCPTCGKPLDRDEETINTKLMMKNGFNESIKSFNDQITQIDIEITKKRKEWAEKNTIFQNLDKERVEDEQKKKELNTKILSLNTKNSEITNKINNLINTKQTHDEKVEKIKKDINDYKKETEILTEKIKILQKNVTNYEFKRQLADYFYKLLGSKGELRPYLLKQDIENLNLFMIRYICRFFENTTVKLQLNGPAIEILIDSNGIKKSVTSLSGGEKKRLNLAIQFALYDLLHLTAQVSFNILWFDEIEAQLDSLGIQQLINVIDDKSEEVESIYWITNSSDVKEHIVNKIICKKICGKTEIIEQ